MTTNEIYETASNLFDGGWKSCDLEEIKEEYELTDDEAVAICEELADIEAKYVEFNGNTVEYEIIENLMDDEIREELHAEYAPCTNQFFLDKYLEAHEAKFHEEFTI
jgi:hypothetical protein